MSGPVAVVAGAGSGLGRALALELAARGARVAALGREGDAVGELAVTSGLVPVTADGSDLAAIGAAFAEIRDRLGPVEILINNTAVCPCRDILDETAESFMNTVATILGGHVACTREALEDMVRQGRGRIVNVATSADVEPRAGRSACLVSRGATRLLTRALLADLGDRFPDIVISDWIPGLPATQSDRPGCLEAAEAARWGAELALIRDPAFSGVVFERDREVSPRSRISARLRDRMLGRRHKPHRLKGTSALG